MGMTLAIVGGLVAMTAIAVLGDYFGKAKQAKSSIDPAVIRDLTKRIEFLEKEASDRDARIAQLETDMNFTQKLLGDK